MPTQTMSYAEMAERLGIQVNSARKLTRRKKWHRTTGNDGTVRVHVPLDELPDRDDTPPAPAGPTPETRIAILETKIEGLTALVDAERGRADAAERDRDAWKHQATRPWWKRLTGQ